MSFAKLQLFSTIGPALAIAIGVAFLAAVTLLPAIIVLVGRRGWIKPRRDLTTRFWRRSGIRIVRRPRANLAASLIVLLILAGCVGVARYNYDDRKALPASVESSIGYAAVDRHFALSSIIPQYLFIQSPHDLRTPEALADLEQMAQRVSQLPGIASIRGVTRPDRSTARGREHDASGRRNRPAAERRVCTHQRPLRATSTDSLRAPTSWPTASTLSATRSPS